MPSTPFIATVAAVAWQIQEAAAIDNGLGLTPPMGWRSWNLYGANVNQKLLMQIMEGMVQRKRLVDGKPTSLCDLGYCDVGLDDNWQTCGAGEDGYHYHDGHGRSIVNLQRFPDMAAMTAHAHKQGLTAGWYGNNCICAESKEPTPEMYEQDVHHLAEVFHFDGVKLDGCGKQLDLDRWAHLINRTGRKIVIENCHWGNTVPTESWCPWNFFRTSGDIRASYGSVVSNLQTTIQWAQKGLSRPGCWAYPDMLEVGCAHGPGGAGDPGLSIAEARTHFGAWCIISSPLTLSHDVNNDTIMDQIWPFIANPEAIAINQAWAGHSGSPFWSSDETVSLEFDHLLKTGELDHRNGGVPSSQFFYKPLGHGRVAVLLMNHDSKAQDLVLNFADVPGLSCGESCAIRDIWTRADLPPQTGGSFKVTLASHDSAFLVLSPAREETMYA
jgi:alpha-galactosidase